MGGTDKYLMQKNSLSSNAQWPCLSPPEMHIRESLEQASSSGVPPTQLMHLSFFLIRLTFFMCSVILMSSEFSQLFPELLWFPGRSSQRKHAPGSGTCKGIRRSQRKLWRWRGTALGEAALNFFPFLSIIFLDLVRRNEISGLAMLPSWNWSVL